MAEDAVTTARDTPGQNAFEVHELYRRRLDERRAERERFARLDYAIGNWRMLTFAVGAVMAYLVFRSEPVLSGLLLVVPLGIFLALVVRHDSVIRSKNRAARAIKFYEAGLRRLQDRWTGKGVTGARYLDPEHPYASDLDVFGRGSLFELLCTARTQAGEQALADWLTKPASPTTIRDRQQAVEELRSRLDLREELAILGDEVQSAIDARNLASWGAEPIVLTSRPKRLVAATLAAITVVTLILWGMGYSRTPFLFMLLISQSFNLTLAGGVKVVVRAADRPGRDLALLSMLLARLEHESFRSPMLSRLRADLNTGGNPPSVEIARLQSLISYLDSANNQLFLLPAAVVLWRTQFAYAIENWRARNGPRLAVWLRVMGEIEAASAVAGYAYEHPNCPLPEIVEEGALFEAEGLAHPLLTAEHAVRNDVRLGDDRRLLIVSGSNMSGKSTLLRAVGVNIVLAQAGAPVCARSLRVSPLRLAASMRLQDSLQAGISHFYAEILRLRQIVGMTSTEGKEDNGNKGRTEGNADKYGNEDNKAEGRVLFLLDEILHGTNSHDRRVGAEAVLRTLIARNAIGFVTTHDLALSRIAEDTTLHAVNVHFEDHLEDGKMTFDYKLRPGIVEKSNAIALMRAVGLDV